MKRLNILLQNCIDLVSWVGTAGFVVLIVTSMLLAGCGGEVDSISSAPPTEEPAAATETLAPTEIPTFTPTPTETATPTEIPTETPTPTIPTETPTPTEVSVIPGGDWELEFSKWGYRFLIQDVWCNVENRPVRTFTPLVLNFTYEGHTREGGNLYVLGSFIYKGEESSLKMWVDPNISRHISPPHYYNLRTESDIDRRLRSGDIKAGISFTVLDLATGKNLRAGNFPYIPEFTEKDWVTKRELIDNVLVNGGGIEGYEAVLVTVLDQ